MTFTKIYLEGSEAFILHILEKAKIQLGDECNVIDLNPELKEAQKK